MKMNNVHKKNKLATAVSCAYVSLALAPVYASDVEIYTQAVANAAIAPIVMMMFDTSGSMEYCTTSDANNCSYPNRRKDVLKDSMERVLLGDATTTPAPGYVKMGLSRYQGDGDGGWVIYPARPLDSFVAINPNGDISSAANTSGSDTSGSSVTSTTLEVTGSNNVGLYFPNVSIPLGATITEAKITLVAKEAASNSTVWETAIDNTGNALPFNTLALDSGSRSFIKADSAVEITPWVVGSSYSIDVKELVQKVAKDNSAWCGGNGMAFRLRDVDFKSRKAYAWDDAAGAKAAKLTVKYSISPTKTDSCIKVTGNVSSFNLGVDTAGYVDSTQELLDDLEWAANATTSGGVNNTNSSLSINKINSGVKNQAVLRLSTQAAVPAGATITNATLTFTASGNYPTGSTTLTNYPQNTTISVYNNLDFPKVCTKSGTTTTCKAPTTTNLGSLSGTTTTWTAPTSFVKDRVYTVDVTNPVKSILPSSGTSTMNSIGLVMANAGTTSSTAAIYSANGSSTRAPKLSVTWSATVNNLTQLTTVRKHLVTLTNSLEFPSATPLAAAYAEASRYLYGLKPFYQASNFDQPNSLTVNSTTADANQRYKSPIEAASQCSGNYIFLLTDGDPNSSGSDSATINNTKGMTGKTSCSVLAADEARFAPYNQTEKDNWRCILDLANVNAKPSLHTGAIAGTSAAIKTSTVILGPLGGDAEVEMKRTAEIGGGVYAKATTTQALVDAMTRTINMALDQSGVLASPGVAINQFNRLNTLDQVYYVLFDPTSPTKRWDGNLKRYKLDLASESVRDVNNVAAINTDGSFKKESQSWWSSSADGAASTLGGAAEQLPAPSDRKMFTYVKSTPSGDLDPIDLSNATFVTNAKAKMPGIVDPVFTNLINWYKGYDIDVYGSATPVLANAPLRKKIGGGLHSRATIVNFGFTGTTTADAQDPSKQINYLFFSTLGATLHAVKASDGEEVFSFIPGEKLPAIKTLYDNVSALEPEYGMDLTWSVYRKDNNNDGQINPSIDSSDKLYMYGGMRMGGRNYYALDLSRLNSTTMNPKLLFSIIGGSSGAYANLGQTWSQPVIADMKIAGAVKTVLVFGGGYDMCYETTCTTSTQLGNQLYIVDAFTGELYWWASSESGASKVVSNMTYSIPTQPKVIDVNGDGLVDNIYFGDLGGQLFRADVDKTSTTKGSLVKRVKLVAKLGKAGVTSASAVDDRRIYEPPTIALFKDKTLNKVFAAVAIGTGNRSHPLNTIVEDRYATLFDFDVTRADLLTVDDAKLQSTLTINELKALDLSSSTSSGIPTYSENPTTKVTSPNTYGWYVNLAGNGEKSLSTGIIFLNRLLFTTYSPEATQTGCSVVAGSTSLYEMCMPYGVQCDADTPRKQASLVTGLGGEPQLIVQPTGTDATNGAPTADFGRLLKGYVDKQKTNLQQSLTPLHRWREKPRYPAK